MWKSWHVLSTGMSQATSNDEHVKSNTSARLRESNITVHLVFGGVLLAILAFKYFLYFGSSITGTGLTPGRVGATLGHLLIWVFAYKMTLRAARRLLMGLIAAPTLLLGVLTFPLVGWIGIIIMFIVLKRELPSKISSSE